VTACAGVDGCKAGWITVTRAENGDMRAFVFPHFSDLFDALPPTAIIAVDMPIGLPERIGRAGRGPEALMRRYLGDRQSSLFTMPSRAAIYAEPGPYASIEDWYCAHRRASEVARATSVPSKAISIQAFALFAKIREIDALLVRDPDARERVIESHPEAAFWRLNGERAMSLPKKIKGAINPPGMEERRALLRAHGLDADFLASSPPRGAREDDFLDACVMLLVAERRAAGLAVACPDPPLVDALGIQIAIWT
jgi:predicted RNase H-like nuclease